MDSTFFLGGYLGIGFCVFLLLIVKDCLFGIKRRVDTADVVFTLSICMAAWPFVFVVNVCEVIATLINSVNNK